MGIGTPPSNKEMNTKNAWKKKKHQPTFLIKIFKNTCRIDKFHDNIPYLDKYIGTVPGDKDDNQGP